jgi:hypothetical protein
MRWHQDLMADWKAHMTGICATLGVSQVGEQLDAPNTWA